MKPKPVPKSRRPTKLLGPDEPIQRARRGLNKKAEVPKDLPRLDAPISRRNFAAIVANLHLQHAGASGNINYGTKEAEAKLRNRLSHSIARAVKNKKLAEIKPNWYRFGDAATWARKKWPIECAKFPVNPVTFEIKVTLPMLGMSGYGHLDPATLAECHVALGILYTENAKLSARITELVAESTRLRANVEHHEQRALERSEKAKIAGKQGGRGNAK